jgi:hypothetical protein
VAARWCRFAAEGGAGLTMGGRQRRGSVGGVNGGGGGKDRGDGKV